MKALVLEAYNRFVWKNVPSPQPGENDVLIKVEACAVCGSDAHGMDGSTGRRRPPVIMGHEAAGSIVACGTAVEGYRPGERVTFDSTVYCGQCDYCRAGRVNLCGRRRVLGVSCDEYRMDGAFAEYVAVPQHILYRLPDKVSFVQAAMTEPLSVACHAAARIPVPAGPVAVIGAGTIGMLLVQTLRAMGAPDITVVDVTRDKLDFALANGAQHVVDSRAAGAAEQLIKLSGSEGMEACYDAVGIEATLQLGLRCVRKGGSMVLVGNLAANAGFPLQWVVTREISLFGSCASAGEYPACLDLIAAGKVDVDAMISKVAPMAEGNEWIHRVKRGEAGLSKLVLVL